MKTTRICSLNNYSSIEELLVKGLSFSRSSVKKSDLSKKALNKIVKAKDEIELPIDLLNRNMISPCYKGESVEVLFEDERLIALNKKYNQHGHPLHYSEEETVLNFLRNTRADLNLGKVDSNQERGLLYRLDEVTSGLLIYIKDDKNHDYLRDHFSESVKKKDYLAVVEGHVLKGSSLAHYFLSKGAKGAKRVCNDSEGEEFGELSYEPLQYDKENNYSLVKVSLKSGLRHQIRAQMAHIGHPLVGDVLYGAKESKRVFLHAYEYQFSIDSIDYKLRSEHAPLFFDFLNFDSGL